MSGFTVIGIFEDQLPEGNDLARGKFENRDNDILIPLGPLVINIGRDPVPNELDEFVVAIPEVEEIAVGVQSWMEREE